MHIRQHRVTPIDAIVHNAFDSSGAGAGNGLVMDDTIL
jgi:hypothetical protein